MKFHTENLKQVLSHCSDHWVEVARRLGYQWNRSDVHPRLIDVCPLCFTIETPGRSLERCVLPRRRQCRTEHVAGVEIFLCQRTQTLATST